MPAVYAFMWFATGEEHGIHAERKTRTRAQANGTPFDGFKFSKEIIRGTRAGRRIQRGRQRGYTEGYTETVRRNLIRRDVRIYIYVYVCIT